MSQRNSLDWEMLMFDFAEESMEKGGRPLVLRGKDERGFIRTTKKGGKKGGTAHQKKKNPLTAARREEGFLERGCKKKPSSAHDRGGEKRPFCFALGGRGNGLQRGREGCFRGP